MLSGSMEIAELLANAGANTTLDQVDAFLAACMRADQAEVDRIRAADATLPSQAIARKPEIIIRATELGKAEAVRLLTELGFDINHVNRLAPRQAPLHQAALDGNLDLVKLLIKLGADPTIQDRSYNSNPLGWAQHNDQREVVDYLASLQPSPAPDQQEG